MTGAKEMRGGQIGRKVDWGGRDDRRGTACRFISGNSGDGVVAAGEHGSIRGTRACTAD